MTARKFISSLALLAAISVVATGCGRRAAPDTPYQAAVEKAEEARKKGEPVPEVPPEPEKDRPFILDPLI